MAKSKYEYVKQFELDDRILLQTYIVVRIDGQGFHKFSDSHKFEKPNDLKALQLMNRAALELMQSCSDIVLAYGQSDEYSFVFNKSCQLFERRSSKLVSTVVSKFTSNYIYYWSQYFDTPLLYPPSFDARAVPYPNLNVLKDYLCWRQVDCHINNLYNLCFWKLVLEGNYTKKNAQNYLKDTDSAMKNELLFSKFNTNYSKVEPIYRKGSTIFKTKTLESDIDVAKNKIRKVDEEKLENTTDLEGNQTDVVEQNLETVEDNAPTKLKYSKKGKLIVHHIDIISKEFWNSHGTYLFPN